MTKSGRVVILNGAPRSGKSSIAQHLQAVDPEPWFNLGVDAVIRATPPSLLPGIGLRPGGERPDLEPVVVSMYTALCESIVAHTRLGLNVVVDVGIHDGYSRPLGILTLFSECLAATPTLFVGVRCSIETIVCRRDAGAAASVADGSNAGYLTSGPAGQIPETVRRWQDAVHEPGVYDLEVDTSTMTPADCVDAIRAASRAARLSAALRRVA